MRKIGAIVRLQIQLNPLKVGEGPARHYDPTPIRGVEALRWEAAGLSARVEGEAVLDVHHAAHPRSRNREGLNGLSIGFTSHYEAMRARFGARMSDGIAGESLIVETSELMTLEVLARAELRTRQGLPLPLRLAVAAPCAPFSTFALGMPPGEAEPETLKDALQFLNGGMRGFYAVFEA